MFTVRNPHQHVAIVSLALHAPLTSSNAFAGSLRIGNIIPRADAVDTSRSPACAPCALKNYVDTLGYHRRGYQVSPATLDHIRTLAGFGLERAGTF